MLPDGINFYLVFFKPLMHRSSHRRCFIKEGILKNLAKFTEKHLCWSLFFNKVSDLSLLKLQTPTQVHSCKFCKIFKNIFSIEHLRATDSKYTTFQNGQAYFKGFESVPLERYSLKASKNQTLKRDTHLTFNAMKVLKKMAQLFVYIRS